MPWDLILRLAAELGVEYQARMKWRARKVVPSRWHFRLVREASKRGESLTMEDFQATPSQRKVA